MPREHSWTERVEEGIRREVRAVRHAGRWRIQSRTELEARWVYHERPLVGDLERLREVLERKYRRRRVSWEDVVEVDKLLAQARREAGSAAAPERGA